MLGIQRMNAFALPALTQTRQHTHSGDDFGVTKVQGRLLICRLTGTIGFLQQTPGRQLIPKRQNGQHHNRGYGGHAHPPVKQEHQTNIQRHPGHIQQRKQTDTGDELAHAVNVIQRLRTGVSASTVYRTRKNRVMNCRSKHSIEADTCHNHDLRTHPLQSTEHHEKKHGDDGQHDQRGNAAGGKHPVINLQHIERGHQHQQIEEQTEQCC